jgi:hypothetical protein
VVGKWYAFGFPDRPNKQRTTFRSHCLLWPNAIWGSNFPDTKRIHTSAQHPRNGSGGVFCALNKARITGAFVNKAYIAQDLFLY